VGVRTFGMSTSMNTNNQWGYKDGLVSVWKYVLLGSGVYNVQYTNVRTLIVGKGVGHF
jgi:hypothetical protein